MNICIDIGNTNAKMGFFSDEELLEEKKNISDRAIPKIIAEQNPRHVLISSVRKGIGNIIQQVSRHTDILVLDHETPLPIMNAYKSPKTLGVDRLATAVGAFYLYNNKNSLIIDIGTCITYDLIDKTGTYQGGGISPGVNMKLKAMHKFTSGLPIVAANQPADLIGKTTKECMLSGVVNGTLAEIEGIIVSYRQFFEDLNIILCGGDAIFFESKIKDHIFAIQNLVLIGLNQILSFNLND